MKKGSPKTTDELRSEYKRSDFGELVRGKYYKRYTASSNVVVLDPDVARRFRNADAVNRALRGLMNGKAGKSGKPSRPPRLRRQAARR